MSEAVATQSAPELSPPIALEGESAAPETNGANSAAFPMVEIEGERFARDTTIQNHDRDPRLTRWGYNPAMRGIMILNRRSGLQDPAVPVGKFFPIRSFPAPAENFTLDENKPKELIETIFASDAEEVVREKVGGVGYQSVLFGEEDGALVGLINQTLLPTLTEIRSLFGEESPVPLKCQGEDELDFGQPREHCASCHLQWIQSSACQAYMQEVAQNGGTVRIRQNGEIQEVTLKPSIEQLEATRLAVQTGLETYLKVASRSWGTSVAELENKKRIELVVDEHYMRKDLHEFKPKDAGLSTVEAFADRLASHTNQAFGRASEEGSDTANTLLQFIAEQREENKQARAESQQFMTALVDRLAGKEESKPEKGE